MRECVRGESDVLVPGSLLTPGRLPLELQMPRVGRAWPALASWLPDRANELSLLSSLEQPSLQLVAAVIVVVSPRTLTRTYDSSPGEPRLWQR